jgi:hypothetical protein
VVPAGLSCNSFFNHCSLFFKEGNLSTYILLYFKITKWAEIKFLSFLKVICVPTYQHLAVFVFVPSVFGEKCPPAEILNGIGRNSLLGN